MKLSELVGKTLELFEIKEMAEVYRINEDGIRASVIGYFKSTVIADAFAGSLPDGSNYNKTRRVLVLTNGNVTFLIDDGEQIVLFNDEEEVLRLRDIALKKLTSSERTLLGY